MRLSARIGAVSLAVVTACSVAPLASAAQHGGSHRDISARTAEISRSSEQDRVRAAAVLGIEAGPSLLVLSDKDFVFELWRHAQDRPEVRESAERAFSGSAQDCVNWIQRGIFEAKERDDRNAEAARLAREAKQRAAAAVGIVATPELLIQSDQGFVFEIWRQAKGPKVRAAALEAYRGTAEQQKAFIEEGIFAAHKQDVQDAIDREEQERKEKETIQEEREARLQAAAVFGKVPEEKMLNAPQATFVYYIQNLAMGDVYKHGEVLSAADKALRSGDDAVLHEFILHGFAEANQSDIEIARNWGN
ncbi:hypothetical protein [Sciscionella sediminilitoris]|uniref:hypothetical protein n=1 Tax=Sciscionella sediminilitoris TaxID=1445613 RepID=UPI0004DF2CA4|nr:hypothetical protein [Sciscionella sp. SE31]